MLQEEVKNSHGRSMRHQRDARVIDRNNRQIIRNCKKDINLAFISNQIEGLLMIICYTKFKYNSVNLAILKKIWYIK